MAFASALLLALARRHNFAVRFLRADQSGASGGESRINDALEATRAKTPRFAQQSPRAHNPASVASCEQENNAHTDSRCGRSLDGD